MSHNENKQKVETVKCWPSDSIPRHIPRRTENKLSFENCETYGNQYNRQLIFITKLSIQSICFHLFILIWLKLHSSPPFSLWPLPSPPEVGIILKLVCHILMYVYLYYIGIHRQDKISLSIFFYFLAMPHGIWDLSSPTRDQTRTQCSGSAKS